MSPILSKLNYFLQNVQKLATLFENPDDVDLTVGGSLEAHVPGTLAGPTFLCILTEQFYRTRAGDRFFYENGSPDTGFTLGMVQILKNMTYLILICVFHDYCSWHV